MAAPRQGRTISRPSIPGEIIALTVQRDDFVDDAAFSSVAIGGAQLAEVRAQNVQAANSRFSKVNLAESHLARFDAADVEFLECNLSNARLGDSSLRCVLFTNCKLTGIQVSNTSFADVEFRNCRLEMASFNKVKFNRAIFRDCQIREGDFTETLFDRASFIDCDLTRATFTRMRLKDSEMRRSVLTGLRGLGQLRGIAMQPNDILAHSELFAAELGIRILPIDDLKG
jgi:uncharacterized protein YjbI with pentapeptide repeats